MTTKRSESKIKNTIKLALEEICNAEIRNFSLERVKVGFGANSKIFKIKDIELKSGLFLELFSSLTIFVKKVPEPPDYEKQLNFLKFANENLFYEFPGGFIRATPFCYNHKLKNKKIFDKLKDEKILLLQSSPYLKTLKEKIEKEYEKIKLEDIEKWLEPVALSRSYQQQKKKN